MFDYDPQLPLNVQIQQSRHIPKAVVQTITYHNKVSAKLILPPQDGTFAACIFLSNTPTQPLLDEAIQLAENNIVSLILDPTSSLKQNVSDARYGIDLLTARADVEGTRLAIIGYQSGALIGGILTAIEPRLTTCILGNPILADKATHLLNYISKACIDTILFQFCQQEQPLTRAEANTVVTATNIPKEVQWFDDPFIHASIRQARQAWLQTHL